MNILQSTVERLLYALLLLCFVTTTLVGVIAYRDGQEITEQQQQFHSGSANTLTVIKQNQKLETVAIKTYIACLLAINPQGNVPAQEQACFDKAPQIMK